MYRSQHVAQVRMSETLVCGVARHRKPRRPTAADGTCHATAAEAALARGGSGRAAAMGEARNDGVGPIDQSTRLVRVIHA